jgi:hypothetical protein
LPSVSRSDLFWAIAIALLTGTLYLVTLRPDVGGTEDSPKFQFLGQVLGTAHTPGYPFYTIATYLFTRPPFGTLAYRVNLFSAVCGVFSCVIIFLMARRLGVSRRLSAGAALAAATGFPVWSNAITAEVYTLSALMSAWTVYLLIAWAQKARSREPALREAQGRSERSRGAGAGSQSRLYAACAVFAAGLGNHLTIVGLLPAALIYGIAKDRGVLKPRIVGIAAIIGALGVLQYGFIALRTVQGAPYLEARATTLKGVYDVIIARDVSWARFYQAADKVVGIEVPMLLDGLRVHMGTITVVLVVVAIGIAIWRRNYDVLLIAGGAAGTLAMIANLWGDVVGFITPVIVLLWPLAAYALESIVRAVRNDDRLVNGVAVAALALPLWNLFAIYPAIEPLRRPGDGPGLRALYSRLPPDSAVVAHNYFVARILNYLDFSNEYDPDPSPKFIQSDVNQVRAAAAEVRHVFALEEAVPWLRAQGLRFEATSLSQQPFKEWIARQPDGTVTVVATAGMVIPAEWLPEADAVALRSSRPANFAAWLWSNGDERAHIEQDDSNVSLAQEFDGRPLIASSNDDGPIIKWGDDVLAAADRGMVTAVINPSGRVLARWHFTDAQQPGAAASPIAFELRGETPCAVLRTGQAVDVSPIVSEGGWYATVDGRQVPAEITIEGGGPPADWRHVLINGRGTAAIDPARSRLLLDGAPGTRAVFQLALPPNQPVHATLETSDHAVRVCQVPVPAFRDTGALETGASFDAHFGVGWHSAEDAGAQRFRWSRRSSSLRWRMDSPAAMRFTLPLRAAHPDGATLRASVNGIAVSTCTLPKGVWTECRIEIEAARTNSGINELTLTSDTIAPPREGDPRELAFELQPARVRGGR